MNILVIDNGTSYLEKIKALLADHKVIVQAGRGPLDLEALPFDLVILSGGHGNPVLRHEREYGGEMELVKSTSVAVLGLCLGFEIIARAFGASPRLLKAREKGILEIYPEVSDPLFRGLGSRLLVYESHRWAIDHVPDQLVSLATSRDGVEIIRHAQRPLYGFQFHPEMLVDETHGAKLFENLLDIVRSRKPE
jgi:anthranilate/para-aminobenzoate synthase component II